MKRYGGGRRADNVSSTTIHKPHHPAPTSQVTKFFHEFFSLMGQHFNELADKGVEPRVAPAAEPEVLLRPKRSPEEEQLERAMRKPEGG